MPKKIAWILMIIFAIIIGLYPSVYFMIDRKFGLLGTKDNAVLINLFWNIGFYTHIIGGGLALLIGWTQFIRKIRTKYIPVHRFIGKIYVVALLLSASAGLFIAFYATGGFITTVGFTCLGIITFFTTLTAYLNIRKGDVINHQKMMIYSYACCFAAVMLRIWLPFLQIFFPFIIAYKIVAWLSWIPNLWVAYVMIKEKERKVFVQI